MFCPPAGGRRPVGSRPPDHPPVRPLVLGRRQCLTTFGLTTPTNSLTLGALLREYGFEALAGSIDGHATSVGDCPPVGTWLSHAADPAGRRLLSTRSALGTKAGGVARMSSAERSKVLGPSSGGLLWGGLGGVGDDRGGQLDAFVADVHTGTGNEPLHRGLRLVANEQDPLTSRACRRWELNNITGWRRGRVGG
jgi:hypothetical protein